MAISRYLAKVWSATDFGDSELSGYADAQLCRETRVGVQTVAGLSLLMQICVAGVAWSLGLGSLYLYTSALFGLLSIHVLVSARFLNDIRSLHALGMAFLTIGALTLTVLAHRSGELHIGMIAATVMLFIAIPLVPWAVRETSIIVGLTYLLLTSSLLAVPGRFAAESLLALQLLVFGAAVIVFVITGRNTFIRKQDLRARYDLENAHDEMQLLTMQDHLTGAWNRRYLDEYFPQIARQCRKQKQAVHVAILDIDDFKGINDQFGHATGDKILISVAETFVRQLGNRGKLIRLGGDEFQIVSCASDLDVIIDRAVSELQDNAVIRKLVGQRPITLSAGIATCQPGQMADPESLYKSADGALYAAKSRRNGRTVNPSAQALTRTGTWKL